jgi:hypothetical protein
MTTRLPFYGFMLGTVLGFVGTYVLFYALGLFFHLRGGAAGVERLQALLILLSFIVSLVGGTVGGLLGALVGKWLAGRRRRGDEGSHMAPEQEEEMVRFATAVVEQPCMPPVWRRFPPSRWRRSAMWGLLRAFLVSRWDSIKEDPNPGRWAQEFIRSGGARRLGALAILLACGILTGSEVVSLGLASAIGYGTGIAENPSGWACTLVFLGLQILAVVICAAYLRRDWLRR